MSKTRNKVGNMASRKARRSIRKGAHPCEWECFIVKDEKTDKTEDGRGMLFSPTDAAPVALPVRLNLATIIFPLNLFRQDGRWCMSFNFLGQGGEASPPLAVKCGEGGPLSMEEAVQLFCGVVPEIR